MRIEYSRRLFAANHSEMRITMNTGFFQGNSVSSNRIIYTPSPFAKANLLHLQEVGTLQAVKPHTSSRDNLPSFLFFLVEKGSGTVNYNGKSYSLQPGDCVFLDCSFPYSHCSSTDLWSLKWAHFYSFTMKEIYQKYIRRGGDCVFSTYRPEKYSLLVDELFACATSDDYVRDMKINEKLSSLLTMLMEESWNQHGQRTDTPGKRNLLEVRNYLDTNFSQKISLDKLAEQFYINKFYLTRLFKEQFGISISTYLIQIRITHAKKLLRFSDLSIDKISRECGLNDANYFSRIFKKVEGISPGEYRKKW